MALPSAISLRNFGASGKGPHQKTDTPKFHGPAGGLGFYNDGMEPIRQTPVGRVVSITFSPVETGQEQRPAGRFFRVAVAEARFQPGAGIVGDRKNSKGKRQMNLMLAEEVRRLAGDGFRAGPGELGEQLVIDGLEGYLVAGCHVQMGEAVIAVGEPRTPCGRFAAVQGRTVKQAWGRLGFLTRVIRPATVRPGDLATLVPSPANPQRNLFPE